MLPNYLKEVKMTPILAQTLYIPPNYRNTSTYRLNPKGYLDTLCYKVDLNNVLMDGDTISNVASMVNDVTVNVNTIDYTTYTRGFTFFVSGGTLNTSATLIFLITTTDGETRSLSLVLPVVVQTMDYVNSDNDPIAIVVGPSNYDLAVANGFVGTIQDYLDSLSTVTLENRLSFYQPSVMTIALSNLSSIAESASDLSCAVNLFDGTPFIGQYLGNTSYGLGSFDPSKVTAPDTKPVAEITAFGYGALNGCTTGRVQTAFGYKALFQSNGWQNSAFGDMAGFGITSGNDNTLIGTHAGRCITTAQGNTALGHGSMGGADNANTLPLGTDTVTTGGNNTGLGAWTLQALSTGIENVAIGAQACQAMTTGSDNVVAGALAFTVATEGSQNTILGSYAGQMSNATANVFVGAGTGQYNTTGGYNVYIGTGAAKSITTGGNNVIIGAMAAQGWNGGNAVSTIDNNCTFIGANAMRDSSIPTTTALENMILIGSGASGDLSNTAFIGAGVTAAYLGGTSKTGDRILTSGILDSATVTPTGQETGVSLADIAQTAYAAVPLSTIGVNGGVLGLNTNGGYTLNVSGADPTFAAENAPIRITGIFPYQTFEDGGNPIYIQGSSYRTYKLLCAQQPSTAGSILLEIDSSGNATFSGKIAATSYAGDGSALSVIPTGSTAAITLADLAARVAALETST